MAEPRPTRPRSWWSWETPKRSASMITMAVAFGTFTPTSMTVVATRTWVSPAAKRRMTASLSSGCIRPCSTSTPRPWRGPLTSWAAMSRTARGGRFSASSSGDFFPDFFGSSSSSPMRGQTTYAWWPFSTSSRTRSQVRARKWGLSAAGTTWLAMGERPSGELVEDRGLQVAEDGHGDRARDGGGRHDEEVGRLLALTAQGVALLDAEAVLLVHDDQTQVVELHLVLDQRVCADDDAGLARDQVQERLSAACGAHRPGEQHHLGGVLGAAQHPALGQLAHHLGDRPVVLLGEHLGGREHGRLTTGVDDGEHGAQRHHRLARTHFALEQPVHRMLGGQVVEDLPGDLLLTLGEGEGEAGVEGGEEAVGGGTAGDGGKLCVGVTAAGEGDLEDEGLVPLEAVAGAVPVRLGVGPVDLQEGFWQRYQASALAQRLGQGVHGLLRARQDRLDGLGDLPGLHLGGGRVDRDEGAYQVSTVSVTSSPRSSS